MTSYSYESVNDFFVLKALGIPVADHVRFYGNSEGRARASR